MVLIFLAGVPTATTLAGMRELTSEEAPTTEFEPMQEFFKTTTLTPSHTFAPIYIEDPFLPCRR